MAARRVLATIGPDATVEQVAKHADVSPATVENYFGSKESLLMTSLDRARPKRLGSYSRTRKGPTPGGADPSP
jgi:AcrR family transcriptional regulator